MSKNLIIGIAGGTGSGKTTITNVIEDTFQKKINIIPQDNYYKDFKDMSFEERKNINFDHPNAFDFDLLIEHIYNLKNGLPIEMPIYDFTTHSRSENINLIKPTDIIVIEGILIFENQRLRDLMDIKIFVDTDADLRLLRRIRRDINERGRSLDSVIEQYTSTVRPMHIEFVEPSKKFADVIIPEGGFNKIGINMIISQIKQIQQNKEL
ncbi:MAG: uridine kinase [Candidatus Cloacimonetes bacterium]|jgi:uridine kinase|nr:uridine kinase [Candidatus Cloacimonadota bacterium]MDD4155702.1 uridine kinase [Candidatus Cloacimonadota bacterium]